VGRRKNIFTIGRKGHEGDENQLAEMLAYLFQEEEMLIPAWLASLDLAVDGIDGWQAETQGSVPGGFADLVLSAPGQAAVIVESSSALRPQDHDVTEFAVRARAAPSTASGP
jgi:hypothetical protein